jgi:hypothetical protein
LGGQQTEEPAMTTYKALIRGNRAMDKIDEICRNRKRAHAKLQSLGSKVYDAFLNMEAATLVASRVLWKSGRRIVQ